ncbi:hypothetical protein PT974_11349 [Cladobotryum mycophilum]|uniref:Uncharacterized protein n=1 Tax=Cladobotryum mycophilum TaxID=491253 RepID=A0ABR0S610_9HYPO
MNPYSLLYTFILALLGFVNGAAIPYPTTNTTTLAPRGGHQNAQPSPAWASHLHPKRLVPIPLIPPPQASMTIECPDSKQPLCKAFSNYTMSAKEKKKKKIKITIGAVIGGVAAVSIIIPAVLMFTGVMACSIPPALFSCPCIIL